MLIDHLPDILFAWITQHGAWALFILLALGIVALPIPDESLLILAGYLIANGDLSWISTTMAAILGAWCGITASYGLGHYLGYYISTSRLGKLIGLHSKKWVKTQKWFHRIGKWSLMVGYFIPGVRHLVGYIAGSLSLPYRQFALFAYSGGAIWSTFFIGLGYVLHEQSGFIGEFLSRLDLVKAS